MIIGTVKEIKSHEYRVGLTPESAAELSKSGHRVLLKQVLALELGQATNSMYLPALRCLARRARFFLRRK